MRPHKCAIPAWDSAKFGSQLYGLLEHLQPIFHILAARVTPPAQVKIVSLRVLRRFARDGLLFLRSQRNAQSLRDTSRDFLLNSEHIFELPVKRSAHTECLVEASTSCAVMRTRVPERRIEPSRT